MVVQRRTLFATFIYRMTPARLAFLETEARTAELNSYCEVKGDLVRHAREPEELSWAASESGMRGSGRWPPDSSNGISELCQPPLRILPNQPSEPSSPPIGRRRDLVQASTPTPAPSSRLEDHRYPHPGALGTPGWACAMDRQRSHQPVQPSHQIKPILGLSLKPPKPSDRPRTIESANNSNSSAPADECSGSTSESSPWHWWQRLKSRA